MKEIHHRFPFHQCSPLIGSPGNWVPHLPVTIKLTFTKPNDRNLKTKLFSRTKKPVGQSHPLALGLTRSEKEGLLQ